MTTVVETKQKIFLPEVKTGLSFRRNRYDILAEILVACEERPRTQSWLLAHLGLSTSSGKSCIDFLVDAKLLEETKHIGSIAISYTTTARGNKALRVYNILTNKYFFRIQMKQ